MSLPYIISNKLNVNNNTSQPITYFNDNSNTISLTIPSGLSNTYTMILPTTAGVGGNPGIFTTDGVNQTSWTDASSGVITTPSIPTTDTTTNKFETTSTTPIVIPGLSQSLTAGIYAVYFGGSVEPDNTIIEYAIYNNGVLESNTSRELEVTSAGADDRFTISTIGILTLPSTQTIDVRINVTTVSTGITVRDSSLSTYRLQN